MRTDTVMRTAAAILLALALAPAGAAAASTESATVQVRVTIEPYASVRLGGDIVLGPVTADEVACNSPVVHSARTAVGYTANVNATISCPDAVVLADGAGREMVATLDLIGNGATAVTGGFRLDVPPGEDDAVAELEATVEENWDEDDLGTTWTGTVVVDIYIGQVRAGTAAAGVTLEVEDDLCPRGRRRQRRRRRRCGCGCEDE